MSEPNDVKNMLSTKPRSHHRNISVLKSPKEDTFIKVLIWTCTYINTQSMKILEIQKDFVVNHDFTKNVLFVL